MQWINNADRMEFSYLPNDQLRNKVVCGLHFQESCFTNELRKRLVHDAIPTLDVGCDPELEPPPEKIELSYDNPDYMDLPEDIDAEVSNDQSTFMTEDGVATIKATSGDGTTFSLATESFDAQQKPHLVTYNFVNGSLVPSVSFPESAPASTSNRNGNSVHQGNVIQAYDDYTAIFGGGDPSVQYITVDAVTPTTVASVRPIRSGRSVTAGSSSANNRTEDEMDSFVLSYVQDPLANDDDDDEDSHAVINFQRANRTNEEDDDSAEECVYQLMDDETSGADMREVHILTPGSHEFGHGHGNDSLDEIDDSVMLVKAEEIVPDNTQRQQRRQVADLTDISADDDDVSIVGDDSLFGGDVDMQSLRASCQATLQTSALLRRRATQSSVKLRRAPAQITTSKAKVRVQQSDIVRPQAIVASSSSVRARQTMPVPMPLQQRPTAKKSITYITTGQCSGVKSTPPTVTTTRMTIPASSSLVTPITTSQQRTTAIIKSTMLPHNSSRPVSKLRTEIQQIIQGSSRVVQTQAVIPTSSSVVGTNTRAPVARSQVKQSASAQAAAAVSQMPASGSASRQRDISLSLASLRSELPPSLYSAISIHLQRKRAFFDAAETEFLTTLYTSTPKGYTTLTKKLGWRLPDEETVKELLELTDN